MTTLALIMSVLVAQTPQHRLFLQPNLPRTAAVSYAFFELAPASGAGMGAACAGTAIAGAKGEAVTWNRAGSAYCTKEGAATTGLTTTSMVLIGSNAPRVEANGKGGLGLRYERDRTNSVLWNEDVTNGAWLLDGAPTVTANTATTAWNTLTADTVSDTSGAAFQGIYQTISAAAGTRICSVYLQGNTSTTPLLQVSDVGGGGTIQSASPTLSTTTISRVVLPPMTTTGGTTGYRFFLYPAGASAAATGSVYVAGFQCEDIAIGGPLASSLILTTSAAVTRATDSPPTYAGVTLTGFASAGSSAATVTPLGTGQTSGAALVAMANLGRALYFNNTLRMYDGTVELALAANHQTGVPRRYWSSWAGATQTLANATDATSTSGAFDGAMDVGGPLQIGSDTWVGTISNFILSELCLDPDSTRCR